ncbi:MAG: uracil-DNA glycosylase [Acidimicrobiia bacterium]|nr:uracil-DNA glycosylase [Acidimicrobiia bacterium]
MCICRRCPRLVAWAAAVAKAKVARFRDIEYWGRPVPSFGRDSARLLVVGLAPAAHGGTRTGRVFTGDRSGDWLYRALHRFGFANQPLSIDRHDGLRLRDSYITAVLHCAPPLNKPLPTEIANCRPFLVREMQLLPRIRVIVALGKIAFDNVWQLTSTPGKPRPRFRHGLEVALPSGQTLLASFHPSQQNTFTGKLTEPMFDSIFARARELLTEPSHVESGPR